MPRLPFAALLLLSGCAAQTAPAPRWDEPRVSLCAEPDVDMDALIGAAAAWYGYGPSLVPMQGTDCHIDVRYGQPSKGYAAERHVLNVEGNIQFSTITLRDGVPFGDATIDSGAIDLQAVLTHEIGHSLGLEHIEDERAVMFSCIDPGETGQRVLSAADVEAVRALYR